MHKLTKKLLSLTFIGLILSSLIACRKEEPTKPEVVRQVKTMTVAEPTTESIREFPGKVLATEQAHLAFEVPGQLNQLPVYEGDIVDKGAQLAALNPKNYQEAVNRTKATMERTYADYRRAGELVTKGFVTRTDFDKTQAEYLVAKANYNTASKDLNDTKIIAPFKGVIGKKFVKNFENVRAKQDVILLQDVSYLDVEINVPEYIIRNLETGSKNDRNAVAIFGDQNQKEYQLTFKEFSSQADPETQTYRVVFRMPSPKGVNILPGMTVTVKVPIPDIKSGSQAYTIIPSSAVFENQSGESTVWIVNQNSKTVNSRKVTVSRLQDNEIRVLSGLKPGDVIVTAGVHFLKEGQQIRLMN